MIKLKNLISPQSLVDRDDMAWKGFLNSSELENIFENLKPNETEEEWLSIISENIYNYNSGGSNSHSISAGILQNYYKFLYEKNIVSNEDLKLIELFKIISDFLKIMNYLLRNLGGKLYLTEISNIRLGSFIPETILEIDINDTITPEFLYYKFDEKLRNNFDSETKKYIIHSYFESFFMEPISDPICTVIENRKTLLLINMMTIDYINPDSEKTYRAVSPLDVYFNFNQNMDEGMFIYSKLKTIKNMYEYSWGFGDTLENSYKILPTLEIKRGNF